MKDQPGLSIITASLNQGRHIERTILSVKSQTYPNIEHIVMDGGSSDDTLSIIKRHAADHPIVWRSEQDRGRSHAWNKSIALATGEWLCFINSSDFLLAPESIEKVFALMARSPGYKVYSALCKLYSGSGEFLADCKAYEGLDVINKQNRFDRRYLPLMHISTFYHRSALQAVGGYCEWMTYAQDRDLHHRLLHQYEIKILPVPVAGYTIHERGNHRTGFYKIKRRAENLCARVRGGHRVFSLTHLALAAKILVGTAKFVVLLRFLFPKKRAREVNP